MNTQDSSHASWRQRLREIIFEAETPMGKAFDVALLLLILLSIAAVMLESVADIAQVYGAPLRVAEWVFTVLFSIEYILRVMVVGRPRGYVLSFYGIVDLLSVLPTYLSVLIPGAQSLLIVRVLRLLRAFRVLKLSRYVHDANELSVALQASRRKILVFLSTVVTIGVIVGAVMYLVEPAEAGFTSIPISVYWAVVTLTTVGYGDITPDTILGRFLAACLMVIGYGVIAVPTGIVTAELTHMRHPVVSTQSCPQCSREGHVVDAKHCRFCGSHLSV
jgi:voltage-gated potassium channel